jgi:co-chaperonin GroES (HSP10)
MNFKPLFDKVIVERVAGSHETAGGIILRSTQEPDRAKILAIGPDVTEVAVGEVVLLNWNAAIKVQGEMYSTKVENIIFVYEEE